MNTSDDELSNGLVLEATRSRVVNSSAILAQGNVHPAQLSLTLKPSKNSLSFDFLAAGVFSMIQFWPSFIYAELANHNPNHPLVDNTPGKLDKPVIKKCTARAFQVRMTHATCDDSIPVYKNEPGLVPVDSNAFG